MDKENIIVIKSKIFALKIVELYKALCEEQREYVISKQILKSGTSIGANVNEAVRGQSKADFYAKFNISLKEASETLYWLDLLYEAKYLSQKKYSELYENCDELVRILVAITKTQKRK